MGLIVYDAGAVGPGCEVGWCAKVKGSTRTGRTLKKAGLRGCAAQSAGEARLAGSWRVCVARFCARRRGQPPGLP